MPRPMPPWPVSKFSAMLLMLESNVPYRLGSAASSSGNHQACSMWMVLGLMPGNRNAFWRQRPCVVSIHTQSPSSMPYSAAVSGCMVTSGQGWNSRMVSSWRCSEWKNS